MVNPNSDIFKDPLGGESSTVQYLGEVVDINDPLKEGRCRIKVFTVFDALDPIDIPWAVPIHKPAFFGQDGKAGSISIPKKGSIVGVRFNNGDIYSPEYKQVQEIGDDIKEELRKDGEYEGAHFVLFDGDEELKVWFTVKKGLTLQLKNSRINIDQNSKITLEHEDSLSIIEMDGPVIRIVSDSQINITSNSVRATADQIWLDGDSTRVGHSPLTGPAVLGDRLFAMLKVLAGMIDAKMPSTPGAAQQVVEAAKVLCLSETVIVGK
jgi:hypothetical protein